MRRLGLRPASDLLLRFERRWPRGSALLLAVVPALVAGYQLAILTLFLNAHLPRDTSSLLVGALRSGLLLAPLSVAAHWFASRSRSRRLGVPSVRFARLLPWSLTAVFVAAALGNWVHASRFSFYLAPALGANLIKLALWLSLAAIVCFYTALLHTVHRRRYGGRSVALLVAMVCGSFYVARARLVSHRPSNLPTPPAVARVVMPQEHLAVVLVDGATLDVLLPLARQSRLPFFSRLFEEGAAARLAPVPPVVPLSSQASLVTGKLPFRHAVLGNEIRRSRWLPRGELRLAPIGFADLGLLRKSGRRPTRALDRRARTVWEILATTGSRVGVVGAPAALLPDDGLAFAASDELFRGDVTVDAFPSSFEGRIRLLEGGAPAPDGPEPSIASREAPWSQRMAQALAQDRWRLAVAESTIAGVDEVDALFVLLPGFAEVALETRMGFEAAELEGSRSAADRQAAADLTSYAAELDGHLERLWERLDPPRLLVVASAFGVDRPRGASRWAREILRRYRLAGTLDGQPDGALWILGDGVGRPGASIPGGRVVDVAPTLLYLAGLPIARDFDGRVLTEAIEPARLQSQPLTFLPTYGPPGPGKR